MNASIRISESRSLSSADFKAYCFIARDLLDLLCPAPTYYWYLLGIWKCFTCLAFMHHHVCLCCFSHVRRKLAVKMVCKSAHFHISFFTPRTLLNACCYCVKKKKTPHPWSRGCVPSLEGLRIKLHIPRFYSYRLRAPFYSLNFFRAKETPSRLKLQNSAVSASPILGLHLLLAWFRIWLSESLILSL